MQGKAPGSGWQALVDVHAHFHPGFDELRFFRSAMANFSLAARALEIGAPWTAIMVLADGASGFAFQRFRERVGVRQPGPLIFKDTGEDESVTVRIASQEKGHIVLVAGSQILTAEGLEVLAVPAPHAPPRGWPIEEVISWIVGMGCVPILPWGFGKWSFGRGKIISRLIRERRPRDFLLADTGHRPAMAPYPHLLRLGEAVPIPVLVGSDPLPLPGEDRRPGSWCFMLQVQGGDRLPGGSLMRGLEGLQETPPRFGQPRGVPGFIMTQVAMQAKKCMGRGQI